ncbi:MAG: single-stranded-DNA-specific exonuclease RecJ [Rhodospirillales bacterium]|nr:single-stranded-DNA-specific exonuclease RecJ [Rhodospirillales bacterium]
MAGAPTDNLFFEVKHSCTGKRWLERSGDSRHALAISQQFQLPEIIGRFLDTRGITADQVEAFLDPKLTSSLPDPAHLLDMDAGVARLIQALQGQEKIAVFGDYDVDGATSSALLARYFKAVGADYQIYIPDRITEGYGPNILALEKLIKDGTKVVITVDCGTTAYEPLAFAKEKALDVVVVDHHVAEAGLPEAIAVINPNRMDEASEHGQLAAVGVTFLLAVALNRGLREAGYFKDWQEPDLMQWLDIVALGTVADMVALTGVNRALVVQGLKVMLRRKNAGLSALADVALIDEAPSTYHLGFLLGPRINAGGRVGESYLGAQLLATESAEEAFEIAQKLDAYNTERREIENQVLQEALEKAEQQKAGSVVYIAGEGWHPGVIGIVASRLKERYGLPSCVLTIEDGKATGSGRSITGVDLGACVIAARQAGIITDGGGHKMAAGFSLDHDRLDDFNAFLSERISKQIEEEGIVPTINIDGAVSVEGATMELVEVLQKLAPFGTGNAEPRFAFSNVRIAKSDVVGVNHVRCFLTGLDSKKQLAAIAFNCVDTELGRALLRHKGLPLHIVGRLRENIWQGRSSVQLLIDDVAPAS